MQPYQALSNRNKFTKHLQEILLLTFMINQARLDISAQPSSEYLLWVKTLNDGMLQIPPEPTIESLQFPLDVIVITNSTSDQCIPNGANRTNNTNNPQLCYNVTCTQKETQPLSDYQQSGNHLAETINASLVPGCGIFLGYSPTEQKLELNFGEPTFQADNFTSRQFQQCQPSLNLTAGTDNDSYTFVFSFQLISKSRYVLEFGLIVFTQNSLSDFTSVLLIVGEKHRLAFL